MNETIEKSELDMDLTINDLDLSDVKIESLTMDDAKGVPEMGATCGCATCCTCCIIL